MLGLPGMKLSWILLSRPKVWKQKSKEYLELISDTYLSVNTPVQNVLADPFSVEKFHLIPNQKTHPKESFIFKMKSERQRHF